MTPIVVSRQTAVQATPGAPSISIALFVVGWLCVMASLLVAMLAPASNESTAAEIGVGGIPAGLLAIGLGSAVHRLDQVAGHARRHTILLDLLPTIQTMNDNLKA
jgi:hypothetical protein